MNLEDLRHQTDPTRGSSLVTFLRTDAGAAARTVSDRLSETIRVKDFVGVVGDGVHDDTAGIQKALDAASARKARLVWPVGKYRTTYSLFVGSDLTIDAYGADLRFHPTNPNACAIVSKSYDGKGQCQNLSISGLRITCASKAVGNGIGLAKADNVTIRDCYTDQMLWHLVDCSGCTNVLVDGCYAKGLPAAAYQVDNLTAVGGIVAENAGHVALNAVVDNSHSRYVTITNCTAESCLYGIQFHRDGGSFIVLSNNTLFECGHGIYGDPSTSWSDIIIIGNQIYHETVTGEESSILLRGKYNRLNISGNICRGGYRGIAVKSNDSAGVTLGRNINIDGNTIEHIKHRAIIADWCSGSIDGNSIFDVGYHRATTEIDSAAETKYDTGALGVSIYACSDMSVGGNAIAQIRGGAIAVRETCENIQVANNVLRDFTVGVLVWPNESGPGNSSHISVLSNSLVGGTYSYWGLSLEDTLGLTVRGNTFRNILYCETSIGTGTNGADVELFGSYLVAATNMANIRAYIRGNAAPVAGYFSVGSRLEYLSPTSGGFIGEVCTTAGTPGTWTTYGAIS